MNGDEIREAGFLVRPGYAVPAVDELLDRVAAELDAGRPARSLIKNAAFPHRTGGYDIDAVDWFLEELLRQEKQPGLAGTSADPWRDLPVVNQSTQGGPGGLVRRAQQWHRAHPKRFAEECASAWFAFDMLPGLRLWWGRAGLRYELRTAEQQVIASLQGQRRASVQWWGYSRGYGRPMKLNADGQSFQFSKKDTAWSAALEINEIADRTVRNMNGKFSGDTASSRWSRAQVSSQKTVGAERMAEPRVFVDGMGRPVLSVSGRNQNHRSYADVSFPDQRWLRFLVRGTGRDNAIMTALDEDGNKVARYRLNNGVEITVNPDRKLTDELKIALAISAPWLSLYFHDGTTPGAWR
jgi:DivIVA domain-containing protein